MADHNRESGIRITMLRARLGRLSQADLGQLINGSRTTDTCAWETGRRAPPIEKISMRLYHLGVNPDFIVGTSEQFCREGFTEDQIRESVRIALSPAPATVEK